MLCIDAILKVIEKTIPYQLVSSSNQCVSRDKEDKTRIVLLIKTFNRVTIPTPFPRRPVSTSCGMPCMHFEWECLRNWISLFVTLQSGVRDTSQYCWLWLFLLQWTVAAYTTSKGHLQQDEQPLSSVFFVYMPKRQRTCSLFKGSPGFSAQAPLSVKISSP